MTHFLSDPCKLCDAGVENPLLCSISITDEVEYELEVAEKVSWDLAKEGEEIRIVK
jgi:hypothetical protein